MSIRVLMVGPGEGTIGGIRSLVESITPVLRRRIELRYTSTVRRRAAAESGRITVRNVALALSQYARFLIALVRFRPDVVHIHTSEGLAWYKDAFYVLAARASARRVILHMHGGYFAQAYSRSCVAAQRLTLAILDAADLVIEVSDERARNLARIAPQARIRVLRNCVDVAAMAAEEPRRPGEKMRVLFLGTVGAGKGVYDLLAAAALVKEGGRPLRLTLAGPRARAADLDMVRDRVELMGLTGLCEAVGPVQGAAKVQLLHECDVFALPSYKEALPMAILEAMAAGLPIVATRVGGIPELVVDGYNGFLITPGDTAGLAQRLMILAAEPGLRSLMGRRSREIAAREYDVTPYVERLVTLYESTVKMERTFESRGRHEDPARHHQLPA